MHEFKRHYLFGVPYNPISWEELETFIAQSIRERKPYKYLELSAPFLTMVRRNPDFFREVDQFDFILPGGAGIILATKLLKLPMKDRISAPGLADALQIWGGERGFRFFLLGATEEVNRIVASHIRRQYPKAVVAGRHHGYFTGEEEPRIAEMIKSARADIVLVATTSPQKEMFINRWSTYTGVPVMLACGGYFDIVAGKTRPAPRWVRKYGFEWLFRVIQEPRRLGKKILFGEAYFLSLLLKEKLFGRVRKAESICN